MIYSPFQPTLTKEGLEKFGLSLKTAVPCNALQRFVYCYLQVKCEFPTPYPVMPDGTQALYISPHTSMLSGAQSKSRVVPLLSPGDYFGIWFYPAALRHFLRLDLSEISGQLVTGDDFSCPGFSQLHREVYRHQRFMHRVRVCEKALMSHYSLKLIPKFDEAVSIILRSSGTQKVEHIAHQVGWSDRHLNRQFLQHAGLGTKAFSKVVRAQNTIKQLYLDFRSSEKGSVDFGYYDQAHLIKDFKYYFNSSPKKFLSDFYNT